MSPKKASPAQTLNPAKTLREATPALDFELPLESGDPRRVDLNAARGGDVVDRLRKLLQRMPRGKFLHAVFASHRGAGKSTELKGLAHDISSQYLPIYFQANVEMDANSFAMEDLLLVIARVVEEEFRQLQMPLPADVLKKVENWFSEIVLADESGRKYWGQIETEAKAETGIPFIGKLLASLTAAFKVESEHRESIKRTLRNFPGTLMTHVNNLLDAAAKNLESSGRSLLLIIDNMDRYEPKLIDGLLVQSADRFKALRCHIIVTPPIDLVLRPESQSLESVFHSETMPTIKLRERGSDYWKISDPGRACLRAALARRIDVDRLIPSVADQDRLIAASGGAIRELLEMAQDATLQANGETITSADVDRVLERRRQRYRDRIDANGWWEALAKIAKTNRLSKDDACLEVLFQRLAFQYNGEHWYDVHPLISDLPDFQSRIAPPKAKGKGRKRG